MPDTVPAHGVHRRGLITQRRTMTWLRLLPSILALWAEFILALFGSHLLGTHGSMVRCQSAVYQTLDSPSACPPLQQWDNFNKRTGVERTKQAVLANLSQLQGAPGKARFELQLQCCASLAALYPVAAGF